MPLTETTRASAREIIARYPAGRSRSALLPMLHLVQAEEGYVTPAGVAFCAAELGLTKAEVGAVATFYTMYKRRPVGEHLVSVCTNLSCQILGGEEVYAAVSRRLGVGHDETTEDGRITLEHAECLAACDYAPVVTVNYEFYDDVTPERAVALVDELRAGGRPPPDRGAPLTTFAAASRELAGFVDTSAAVVAIGAAHPLPPRPVDVRGAEPTGGTDVDVAPEAARYGIAGGVTERALTDRAAAATYGDTGETVADAGASPVAAADGVTPPGTGEGRHRIRRRGGRGAPLDDGAPRNDGPRNDAPRNDGTTAADRTGE